MVASLGLCRNRSIAYIHVLSASPGSENGVGELEIEIDPQEWVDFVADNFSPPLVNVPSGQHSPEGANLIKFSPVSIVHEEASIDPALVKRVVRYISRQFIRLNRLFRRHSEEQVATDISGYLDHVIEEMAVPPLEAVCIRKATTRIVLSLHHCFAKNLFIPCDDLIEVNVANVIATLAD